MRGTERPEAILIAGPTASGKSALAIRLARRFGGAVVNADSMQVYNGLRILTARPSGTDLSAVPHHLYGHRDPAMPYSAGDWLREVAPRLAALRAEDRIPVFCGGTGLYFRALLGGLDDMPEVPPAIRERWRARMVAEGPQRLHGELAERDPAAAARIRASDPQRIVRALELWEVRGASDRAAPGEVGAALVDPRTALKLVIAPERPVLRERIARRFDAMLEEGALREATAFARRPNAMTGLAGKAIGLTELLGLASGTLTEGQARDAAVTRTRQYAKRQETWFRNQFGPDWRRISRAEEVLPD